MRPIRASSPARVRSRTDGCAPSRARRLLRLGTPRIPSCFARPVDPGFLLDNLGVQLVHDAQVVWRANPIYLQRLQQHQDVLDAGQVDAPLSSELLNDLQLAHVALGVAPPV